MVTEEIAPKFMFEGSGAMRAAQEFLEATGLEGRLAGPDEPVKEGALAEIAIVLGIGLAATGMIRNAADIADRILIWRARQREKREAARQPPLKAVLEGPDGARLHLEDASAEDIAEIVKNLAPQPSGD